MASAPAIAAAQGAIRFYSTSKTWGALSNFAASPFQVDFVQFKTVEHYFQHAKAVDAGDAVVASRIAAAALAAKPASAKALGRRVKGLDVAKWNARRIDVMRTALRAKFSQHAPSRAALLETGTRALVEAAPRDYFWGCGAEGSGRNMLGELLQEVRAELRDSGQRASTSGA
jgi:ribA/ribD-fused uncharacterized protein